MRRHNVNDLHFAGHLLFMLHYFNKYIKIVKEQ